MILILFTVHLMKQENVLNAEKLLIGMKQSLMVLIPVTANHISSKIQI